MPEIEPFNWTRTSDLRDRADGQEIWTLTHGQTKKSFDVNVTFGKAIDIKGIKKDWPFKTEVEFCTQMRKYFESNPNFVPVENCPICGSDKSHAKPERKIWSENYFACEICGHAFMEHFPEAKFAEEFYASNYSAAGYYTNEEDIEFRLAQIYRPKIDWIVGRYRQRYGRDPRSIFDVGAGAGHTLYAAHQKGLSVNGVERDTKYREFCQRNFGITLFADPQEYHGQRFDVVMSFNVIEHVDDPFQFLAEYKELLSDEPLAVVETPKYNSVTSTIQTVYKDKIRGHLAPYQHNHMFSDSSLATLFYLNGYDISDLWIFGNDAIELILQIADELDAPATDLIDNLYPQLQKSLDRSMASDIMILAAVPSI